MSALDVLRQIKQLRRTQDLGTKTVEWGNADFINSVGLENLTRKELRNHLEARDLDTTGTRLELMEKLRSSLADEQLHKFAYVEALDTDQMIQADLEERGSVYVCGLNDKGQLGLGDLDSKKIFTPIAGLRGVGVVNVSCGGDMSYAVTQEHDVYVWGGGGVGRTGINPHANNKKKGQPRSDKNFLEPQIILDLAGEECTAVSIGSSHSLAVGRGGDCFVWGDNESGQLGIGNFDNKVTISVNNSFPPILQVCCGSNHSMVLTKTRQVYAWGHGYNGRLGIGEMERIGADERQKNYFPVPSQIRTLEPVTQVSCGSDHTLAIGSSGLWSWGCGSGYKLGLGDVRDRMEPNLVPKLRGRSIKQVVASTWFSLAIVQYPPMLSAGYVYSWGSGYYGQLAQGTKSVVEQPEIVEYFVHCHLMIKLLAAGQNHCLAVTQEGELYSWGNNTFGALGRRIEERDVQFTPMPGHVPGFGALFGRIGRGFPRSISCGRDFSVVATFPYEGPDFLIATKLMEEAKIREQELLLTQNRDRQDNSRIGE